MNQTPLLGQYQGLYHTIVAMNQQQEVMNMPESQRQAMMMTAPNFSVNHNLLNPNNYGHNLIGKQMEPTMRMHDSGIPIGSSGNRLYKNVQPQLHGTGSGRSSGYKPPVLKESQKRKFYPKKTYGNRYVPYAPRNTSSFIIRAKKSGGIADLVSPCPMTPSVLPTPMFSPPGEILVDMVKEEWGVDRYGSMEGLIRLRSDGGHGLEPFAEDEGGSCESDEVDDHVEVERRLNHDLSRFEMVCPTYGDGFECNNVLEKRIDDQDSHVAQLEEDSLAMKVRLLMMERDFCDLRRRLESLERHHKVVGEDGDGEVVENKSESDETGRSGSSTSGDTKENHLAATL